MKYTIKQILPSQIYVEFEDHSTAYVMINPESTPEEIDYLVSNFDPEFLPDPESLINENIDVGEERTSNPILESKQPELPKEEELANQIDPINSNFGISDVAEYFASQGDNRLKDALNKKIEAYVNHENFSIDALVANYKNIPIHYPIAPNIDPQLDSGWEDILRQAEEELNAEQS